LELEDKLTALGIAPQRLVVNQVYPDHFPAGAPVGRVLDALAGQPAVGHLLAEVAAHGPLARDRRRLNERYLAELARRTKTPITALPILFAQTLGPGHVQALGERLAK